MAANFNTWTIVFLVAAIQGIFLGILIFQRKSKANNLLAALILSFSICLLFYVGFWTGYNRLAPFRLNFLGGLTYTFGPLAYFYIRSSKKILAFNYLHFLPFLGYLIYFLAVPYIPSEGRPYANTIQILLQNICICEPFETHPYWILLLQEQTFPQ